MKERKGKWGAGFRIVTVLAVLLAFCLPVYAGVQEADGEYEVYPTPQSVEYASGSTALTQRVTVEVGDAIDSYTQTRIEDTLAVLGLTKATSGAANTRLIVGVYGTGDAADTYGITHGVDGDLYSRYDAYTLWIDNGDIVILGRNTDAAYGGVTTLKRIFEQLDGKSVRNLVIQDYAEVQFRGFIEGYYGNPWSMEDRIDLMQYGGEIKMNQYVYAPKDDPMHNARWRTLYDEEGLKNIAALAQAGNESKCFFVYALHTFMNQPVNLSDATYESEVAVVKAKFEQVIRGAGVRQIAILEDDASGETAQHMIRFLNDMHDWLVELKEEIPDLKTDILYCPTCYMSTSDSKMTTISQNVSKEIHIVVTGGKIWGEVSESFATAFYNGLGGANSETARYPYMWVNWPCNDNTKNSQIMGGHNYILHTGVDGSHYEGIILNPIQESEPSKVGIFTAADYCWNIWQDAAEGDQAWEDSFKYIDHMTAIENEASEALRETAKHQIAQAASQTTGKQVPFEESVDLKPLLDEFKSKLNAGTLTAADTDKLKAEFQKICDAAEYYMQHGTNRRMASQMTPFLSCLRDMTQADACLMDAVKSVLKDNKSGIWAKYSEAQTLYDQSKTYGFAYYNAGTLYAQAGRKYIEPFTDDVMKFVSDEVKALVSGEEPAEAYQGTLSHTDIWTVHIASGSGPEENLTDGNDSTYVWYNVSNQDTTQAGDYIQLDLGEVKPVGRVRALVGAGDGDKWTKYHVEYSQDGTNWTKMSSYTGAASGTDTYIVDLQGKSARYVKLVNDTTLNKWVKFSEFTVFAPGGGETGMVYTNTVGAGLEAQQENDRFALLPKDGITLKTGEYIGLKLDRIHEISSVSINGTGMDNLSVEQSMNAKEWVTGASKGNARYIRLCNQTNADVTFDLTSFTVLTNELWPMDLLETSIGGQNSSEDARRLGTTKNWMDGDLSTKAKYCAPPVAGSYVTYDLGQEITLRSLRMYVLDTAIDYPRDAKLQASTDNVNWTDILEVGDGIENGAEDASVIPVTSDGEHWKHDTVDVAYAYAENANIDNVPARYIRLYFTAGYQHRWVELNEIRINGGEYIPSINDPTFETDAALQKGYEPQNLCDGDLTTAFRPDGTQKGYLLYHLSDGKTVGRLNILQSGNAISNAKVSVRTEKDTWTDLGTLSESYSAFYTADLENLYDIKIEWDGVVPTIYEIITMTDPGDVLDKNIEDAKRQLNAADAETASAQEAVDNFAGQVKAAEAKVNAAANAADKLRAEIELQSIYAQKAAAEAVLAEKKAISAVCGAEVAKAEAKKFRISGSEADAVKKDTEAADKLKEADAQRKLVSDKKKEQAAFEQAAKDKQAELEKLLNTPVDPKPPIDNPNPEQPKDPTPTTPEVKNFKTKTLKYKVVNASKKTVAVTGPVKKTLTSATIPATVKYNGVTYKVVEISDSAFKGCAKLTKVTVGSNVTKIGKKAFYQCKKLKTINMKKASKITSFGKNAFSKIASKAKVTVPAKKLKSYKKDLKKTGLPKKATVKK